MAVVKTAAGMPAQATGGTAAQRAHYWNGVFDRALEFYGVGGKNRSHRTLEEGIEALKLMRIAKDNFEREHRAALAEKGQEKMEVAERRKGI